MSLAATVPVEIDEPLVVEDLDIDKGWNVIVWDDPVNLMSYVVLIFKKLFGFSTEKATKLMLQVHNEGKAIVTTAPRERAELDCHRLHRHGLWATMERV